MSEVNLQVFERCTSDDGIVLSEALCGDGIEVYKADKVGSVRRVRLQTLQELLITVTV